MAAPQTGYHLAKVLGRHMASPTVMILELELAAAASSPSFSSFQFQPGQWVDFMVPPHKWVGGFSPASIPSEFPRITLAVKRSNHPPSQWVHSEQSKELGRPVQVQVGGTCVLDTSNLQHQPVVFCAGGIGISPLLSMYRYWNQLQRQHHSNPKQKIGPSAFFFYTVSTEQELVFKDELVGEVTNAENKSTSPQQLTLTLTKQKAWTEEVKRDLKSRGITCLTGRYMKDFLLGADPASSFYLCGPPAMIDEGIEILEKREISQNNIHYEKWW